MKRQTCDEFSRQWNLPQTAENISRFLLQNITHTQTIILRCDRLVLIVFIHTCTDNYLVYYAPPSCITALLWWRGLYNPMKLWDMSCRATQDRQVIVQFWQNMFHWSTGWQTTPVFLLYIVTLLIQIICRVHHAKCQLGWSASWNKIAGRNINNLSYTDDMTLMAETEEELRASWWKWKRRVKKLA